MADSEEGLSIGSERKSAPTYDAMGESEQSIIHRGFILSTMLRGQRSSMTEEQVEALDFFITASYSVDNPPPGFSSEQWYAVENRISNSRSSAE